jgi:large subunit ribosomal protein L29
VAIIKKKALKEMTEKDLKHRLSELRLELAKEMAQVRIGGVSKSPGKIKEMRRTIARILTKLSEIKRTQKTQKGERTGNL